eukprot:gene15733-21855_t
MSLPAHHLGKPMRPPAFFNRGASAGILSPSLQGCSTEARAPLPIAPAIGQKFGLASMSLSPQCFAARSKAAPSSSPASRFSLAPTRQQLLTVSRARHTLASAAASEIPDPLPSSSPIGSLLHQNKKFTHLIGKFLPMVGLFFLLAFVNTILDSLKDTLVITSVGGGAQVIPYLTVYAVLPSSLVFLLLYSYATQKISRSRLFSVIISVFMCFFATFAFFLYPNEATLHPHALADKLALLVPSGLSGLVGMCRNWTYTLFFCMSELWGDVCLGLLFWGLANDTTTVADAPMLYPLFGLGANIAQALAGFVLKRTSGSGGPGSQNFAAEVQSLMVMVLGFSFAAIALHSYINHKAKKDAALREAAKLRHAERAALNAALVRMEQAEKLCELGDEEACKIANSLPDTNGRPILLPDAYEIMRSNAAVQARLRKQAPASVSVSDPSPNATLATPVATDTTSATTSATTAEGSAPSVQPLPDTALPISLESTSIGVVSSQETAPTKSNASPVPGATDTQGALQSTSGSASLSAEFTSSSGEEEEVPQASLQDIFRVLAKSTPIRCLAVMSLAQGLCSSLMEFAWKSHIRLLYPSPGEFTAFLGDVSTCQGVATGLLMFVCPALFARLGWRGVACTSPYVLLFGGSVFFSICIMYEYLASSAGASMAATLAPALVGSVPVLLNMLVFGGAALYVFSKSAKFSLFKPAEEMVYISMDEEGRTKGKAAIDVVGSQAGKSGGSILQQLLLLFTGGAIAGSIPIMFAVFVLMAQGWLKSVHALANHADYGNQSHKKEENDEPKVA